MEKQSKQKNDTDVLSLSGKDICIYGAGVLGRNWYYVLKKLGYNVIDIQDQKASSIHMLNDTEISNPDFSLAETTQFLVAIADTEIRDKVIDEIEPHGLCIAATHEDLMKYCSDLAGIDTEFSAFRERRCVDCVNFIGKNNSMCPVFTKQVHSYFGQDALVVPVINAMVVDVCNLNCNGCGQNRDSRKSKKTTVDCWRVFDGLKKLHEAGVVIPFVEVIGGETFLCKELKKLINEICSLPNIGLIQLASNGTIIPHDLSIFEVISNTRINVKFSDYFSQLPKKMKEKNDELLKVLDRYNVRHFTFQPVWHDFGDFSDRGYSEDDVKKLYENCCYRGHTRILINENLYSCVFRSSFFSPEFDESKDDFIIIDKDIPVVELRKKLKESLSKEYFKVCGYCNGNRAETICCGIQKK